MNWYKLVWQTYKVLASIVAATRITRLRVGSRTFGERVSALVRRCFSPNLSSPISVHGHKMYLHPVGYFSIPGFISERYEVETCTAFERTIRLGMTMVDVGAHIGFFTLLAARLVGEEGKVFAFEPEPPNFALLIKNVQANEYESIVEVVGKAVSNKEGMVELFFGQRDSGESSMYPTMPGAGSKGLSVDATTLDLFFERESWPPVHLIKMDIEGAEKAALEGSRMLIERNPQLKLIVEFSPLCLNVAGVASEEFFKLLQEMGFKRIYALRRGKTLLSHQDASRLARILGEDYDNLFCEK